MGLPSGPELGGPGFGQIKLALLNEILGRTGAGPSMAPIVFGCAAPDTGNAEILAHYGTPEHKETYLQPLLNGEIFSCFSMTEPQAGSDPTEFTTTAELDGDTWILNGEKWFSSNARWAAFLIVMAVSDPAADPRQRMSMFIVPTDTPGVHIIRNVALSRVGTRVETVIMPTFATTTRNSQSQPPRRARRRLRRGPNSTLWRPCAPRHAQRRPNEAGVRHVV